MNCLRMFCRYVGIDYSGAGTSNDRLGGLQVFMADRDGDPVIVGSPAGNRRNWTRKEIAEWCAKELRKKEPTIIGIDHVFSFPLNYLLRYGIENWDHFMDDFQQHWPTDQDGVTVASCRPGNNRSGDSGELRLTERWTSSAKSVFHFGMQGTVANSSHAGIPWLRSLRKDPELKDKVHFWPFDGWKIPTGTPVVAEVYPSIFRRRYPRVLHSNDQHDAHCIAKWLQDMDCCGALAAYFSPLLTRPELKQAALEGWILGIL